MTSIEQLINAVQSAAGGRSTGQLLQSFGQGITDYKNRVRGVNLPLGQRPVVNPEFMRPDYSGAGERARRFQEYRTGRDISGANTDYSDRLNAGNAPAVLSPGATPPAVLDPYAAQNRAYQQERARVEAMVKANPDMQKQEIADARAKVRDQGMAIWQQKYGNTPMGRPGGAVGMRNPLMDRTFGYQSGSAPDQQMGAPTLGPSPLVPQVDQSLNPASPNFIGGEGAPIMNFADPRFENMSPEEFQKLLNQVNKK